MPWINGRAKRSRLLLIGGMAQSIVKGVAKSAFSSDGSEIEFADGVTGAVAGIGGAVGVAGVGRLGRPDSHEPHRDRSRDQANGLSATLAGADSALRESLPDAASGRFDGIVAGP